MWFLVFKVAKGSEERTGPVLSGFFYVYDNLRAGGKS